MDQELEKTLWATADKLRNNMDAAEDNHIVLGLIFLKYISDSFEDLHTKLKEDNLSDSEANNFVLTPGRYVGTEEVEDDGIPYEEKVATISENLKGYFEQSIALQERIKTNLVKVGIEI